VTNRIPRPTFRQSAIAAGILLAVAGSYAVWRASRPTTITVCVVTDYSFRNAHANWRDLLAARFQTAQQAFGGTGVHWDFHDADQPDPTGNLEGGIEDRRQKLIRTECEADVILGVTGQAGVKGDVPPFSHTAIVGDSDALFVQGLAMLFGAPANAELPKSLIRHLRDYDFARGTEALDEEHDRVYKALVAQFSPAEAHRILGMSQAADGRYPGAIRDLKERVSLEPSNAGAHIDLATIYTHAFETPNAIEEYRAAVKLEPNNPRDHAALAIAFANAGLAEDAIDEFHAALRLDPKFATAQSGLAYVLTQQPGEIDEAIAAYQTALQLDPNLQPAATGLERAKTLKAKAQADLPEQQKKAQSSPSNPQVHFALGLAEARAGNVDAAIKSLRRAVDLDASNALAHEQLALLLYRRGDTAGALVQAQAAAKGGYEPPKDVMDRLRR
jgi:Flp pilus assembly protein TadD